MIDDYFLELEFYPKRVTEFSPLSNTYLICVEAELETWKEIVKEVEGEVTQNREWEYRYMYVLRPPSWGELKCQPTFLFINYKVLWDREKKVPDDLITRLRDVLDIRSDIQKEVSPEYLYVIGRHLDANIVSRNSRKE